MEGKATAVTDFLVAEGNLADDAGGVPRGVLRDAFDDLGSSATLPSKLMCLVRLLLLDVLILGVLARNSHIDELRGGHGGLDGAYVGVQVELLAQDDGGIRLVATRVLGTLELGSLKARRSLETRESSCRERAEGVPKGLRWATSKNT